MQKRVLSIFYKDRFPFYEVVGASSDEEAIIPYPMCDYTPKQIMYVDGGEFMARAMVSKIPGMDKNRLINVCSASLLVVAHWDDLIDSPEGLQNPEYRREVMNGVRQLLSGTFRELDSSGVNPIQGYEKEFDVLYKHFLSLSSAQQQRCIESAENLFSASERKLRAATASDYIEEVIRESQATVDLLVSILPLIEDADYPLYTHQQAAVEEYRLWLKLFMSSFSLFDTAIDFQKDVKEGIVPVEFNTRDTHAQLWQLGIKYFRASLHKTPFFALMRGVIEARYRQKVHEHEPWSRVLGVALLSEALSVIKKRETV